MVKFDDMGELMMNTIELFELHGKGIIKVLEEIENGNGVSLTSANRSNEVSQHVIYKKDNEYRKIQTSPTQGKGTVEVLNIDVFVRYVISHCVDHKVGRAVYPNFDENSI